MTAARLPSCGTRPATRDAEDNTKESCAGGRFALLVAAMFDLTTGYDAMGRFDHPDLQAALAKVAATALAAGIPMGSNTQGATMAHALFERGYRTIVGFDALWLQAKTAKYQLWTRA